MTAMSTKLREECWCPEGGKCAACQGAVEIERLDRLLTTEERDHSQTIGERDAAQEAFDELYTEIMGQSPEWSNLYTLPDALNDCLAALERRPMQAPLEKRTP